MCVMTFFTLFVCVCEAAAHKAAIRRRVIASSAQYTFFFLFVRPKI
jgi:hypothetical protein